MSNGILQTLIVEATDRKREASRKLKLPNQTEAAIDKAYQEFDEACKDLKSLYYNQQCLERLAG